MKEYHAIDKQETIDVLMLPNSIHNKEKIDNWRKCVQEDFSNPIRIHRIHYFQYDTFENPEVYKTLPFIVDRLNEMRVRDQQRISKYMHSLNKKCNELKCMNETIPFFNSKVIDSFDIDYYKELVRTDYCNRLFQIETTISYNGQYNDYKDMSVSQISTLFDYLRNYTVTKIKKCV